MHARTSAVTPKAPADVEVACGAAWLPSFTPENALVEGAEALVVPAKRPASTPWAGCAHHVPRSAPLLTTSGATTSQVNHNDNYGFAPYRPRASTYVKGWNRVAPLVAEQHGRRILARRTVLRSQRRRAQVLAEQHQRPATLTRRRAGLVIQPYSLVAARSPAGIEPCCTATSGPTRRNGTPTTSGATPKDVHVGTMRVLSPGTSGPTPGTSAATPVPRQVSAGCGPLGLLAEQHGTGPTTPTTSGLTPLREPATRKKGCCSASTAGPVDNLLALRHSASSAMPLRY